MTTPEPHEALVALVVAGEDAIRGAASHLSAEQRTQLLRVLLDTFGEERVREAVQKLPARDATKTFKGTVGGLLAKHPNDDSDSADERLRNALSALDDGHDARMLRALNQRKPRRLLSAATHLLKDDRRLVMKELGLETEDVLKRVAAADTSSEGAP